MSDFITTKEYSEFHGIPFETVRTWVKQKKLAHIKIGDRVLIERNTPIPAKRKPGRKSKAELENPCEPMVAPVPESDIAEMFDNAARKSKEYRKGYNDGYKDGYAKAKADILARLK